MTVTTFIAAAGVTQITSPDVPPKPLKHRNFRLDDRTWFAASRIAELRGSRISDVARDFFRGYVRRHAKLIENDPVWIERERRANETGEW